jgi:hypothetical protein
MLVGQQTSQLLSKKKPFAPGSKKAQLETENRI